MTNNIKLSRLKEAFEELKRRGLAHKQQDIVDKMHRNKSSVSQAFNGNERYLTEKFLLEFNDAYYGIFNNDWLLGKSEEMLNGVTISPVTVPTTSASPTPKQSRIIGELRYNNKNLSHDYAKLKVSSEEKDDQIKEMDMLINKKNVLIAELEKQLREKDDLIKTLINKVCQS